MAVCGGPEPEWDGVWDKERSCGSWGRLVWGLQVAGQRRAGAAIRDSRGREGYAAPCLVLFLCLFSCLGVSGQIH